MEAAAPRGASVLTRHRMPRIASILLPLPLPEAFDYAEPEGMDLAPGDQVVVPLGPRLLSGVVSELRDAAGHNRPLKPVLERRELAAVPATTLEFVQWAARYAVDAPGQALAIALRGARAPRPRPERLVAVTGASPRRMTPARARVLAAATQPMSLAALAEAAEVSDGVVRGLVEDGALEIRFASPAAARIDPPDPSLPGAPLNPSQAAAAAALRGLLDKGGFQAALLDGVTGSGKTEVYLEAAAAVLAADPHAQVLVLLPEIALTRAVIARFEQRFGATPAEWHSGIAPPRRRMVWEAVADGRCRIVVGARSALFLPFADLRLVVVDEEHDGSYKQEDGFIYQARDLAVARAKIEDALVVLASATPSLESLWNAETGRYHWLRLSDRHGAAELPDIGLIDLRETPPEHGRWLSGPLVSAMAETWAQGEQSLLFLNRRGYAPLVLCKACGERMTAPDTDSWLVEHRYTGRLVCHLTGFSMPKPDKCPHCGAKDALVSIGPGVERVEEECRSLFPEARIAVFSSDTMMDAEGARRMIQAMEEGQIDILVATQVAAKGHNFPNLTLVGVVDADLGLRGGDLRAGERTYQLLAQATGRAGRHERPGRALIQTYAPDHPVMRALKSQDRDAFVAAEMAERQAAGLPPFGRLAAVIAAGPDAGALEAYVRTLAAAAPNAPGVEVYGPADAPLGLIRGRRRKRFLVRADRNVDLQAYMAAWRARARVPGSVRVTIDMDPYSFL
jgi:primosomal protein N' (replication factor Y) (superfamily II helicase)